MSKRKHQVDAAFQHAQRLHAAGRLPEAEQGYRQILAAAPLHADTLHMLGVLALQTGHPAPALTYIERAIAQASSVALYHVNRASALLALQRPGDAEAACREALRLKRNSAEAQQTLGHALSDIGRPEQAAAAYREALRLNPRLPALHNNLGLVLHEASRLDEAVEALRIAVRQAPQDTGAISNLAGVLKDAGRLEEAESLYRALLQRNPNDAAAHYNLGVMLLVAGRFEQAWPEWEWRFRADPALAHRFTQPSWTGGPLGGRTLLVHAEQGIGDMVQFSRYVPLLPRDGRVVLEVHPPLVPLLRQLDGVAEVVAIGDPLPAHDLRCPMMSLPLALGLTRAADIPASVPYLKPDPARVTAWRERLAALPGRRVGVVWAGNPERMRMDRRRSLNATALAPLAAVPGVSLVSLQKGPAAAQLPPGAMTDWTADLADFVDTAALIEALDLVIAVDTAVLHVAGALGKPVWLLNRFDTCWRWELGCDDSRWYPTLRQFRQTEPGVWDDVVVRVCEALAA
ncbi:MAG: tetratricopeptide repeat-containing glycosyltransferase family protein [Acetobacteraceae bacterium]|nr:tetratricopeptide repeat-containing glycosyltransferase family protein [Acetobacteraceae bacterium]